jgi:hypothetical protein
MDAIPQLVQAVSDIIINIADFLVDPANLANILKAAVDVVIALATGLINAIPVLLGHLPKLWGSIIENFKETDWGELGKNIVDGLLKGLKKAWESLKKWFTNAWDNLVGGVKDFLGIHSPSRVFAGIGKNMALGVGEGWQNTFGGIQDDINDSLDFGEASFGFSNRFASSVGNGKFSSKTFSIIQNIYAKAQTPSELMSEALYQQKLAVIR